MNYTNIIKRIQSGEQKAERQLFDNLAPRLLTMCRRYAHDEGIAKDYLQDCFIHVFNKLGRYNEKHGKFETWFFKVCLNVILMNKRLSKRSLQICYVDKFPEPEMIEDDLSQLSDDDLVASIQQLPEGYRTVLNLYVFEKLSHKEIGGLIGISPSTSRSQFARAKSLLKKLLKKRNPDLHEKILV